MPNLTSVGLTAGLGTSGTGTISTLDNLIGTAGTASAQVLSVQGIASGTAMAVNNTAALDKGSGTGGTATQRVIVDSSQLSALGQTTMSASQPVTIASDQSAVAVKGSGTAGTANAGVLTVQGIASMTKLLVTPDSVALPANQSVNIAQVAGATTAVGSGVQATALRTTLATDSPGIVTLGQTTKSASVPVTIASDQGALTVSQQSAITGGYSFLNISTDATTTVKSGAGTLHTITVNTLAATSTITIYDNTAASGTKIGTIAGGVQNTYLFDVAFATGLTIVTATAAPDITVTYK